VRQRQAAVSGQKASATHRISNEPDGGIDSEKADIEWPQNTVQLQPPISERGPQGDDGWAFGGSHYLKVLAMREYYREI